MTEANRYGKYNEDGSVTEPEFSILTGSRIFKEGSISEMVGKMTFVRYEGGYADRVTDEMREEWKRNAPGGKQLFGKKQDTQESGS